MSPYTLNSDNKYKVVIMLSIKIGNVMYSTQHACYLIIKKGPLKAILFPSGHVSLRFDETFVLNAAESYDSNVGVNKNNSMSSSIKTSWTCVALDLAKYSSGCGDLITIIPSQSTLLVNSTYGTVGVIYRISFFISASISNDDRMDYSFIDVSIENECCSKLSVPSIGFINSQEMLSLDGQISTSVNGIASWALLDSKLDLRNRTTTPLQ
jgi:hypothetical protein